MQRYCHAEGQCFVLCDEVSEDTQECILFNLWVLVLLSQSTIYMITYVYYN